MWRKNVLSYFHYTKKERTGIFVLMGVILLLWIIPWFFSADQHPISPVEIVKIKEAMIQIDSPDHPLDQYQTYQTAFLSEDQTERSREKIIPFPFDPNSTSEHEWVRLGLGKKTASTIRRYLEKGGRFRRPEDLKKVYGIRTGDYERLAPFIRIKQEFLSKPDYRVWKKDTISAGMERPSFLSTEKKKVDINKAGAPEWESLPGIGEKLAARIILFRQKLGGFHSIEQVGDTYGVSPELFDALKQRLEISDDFVLKPIDINTAEYQDLKEHPYIGAKLASLIISYRKAHGGFKQLEDLKLIPIVTDDQLTRVKPYLSLSNDNRE